MSKIDPNKYQSISGMLEDLGFVYNTKKDAYVLGEKEFGSETILKHTPATFVEKYGTDIQAAMLEGQEVDNQLYGMVFEAGSFLNTPAHHEAKAFVAGQQWARSPKRKALLPEDIFGRAQEADYAACIEHAKMLILEHYKAHARGTGRDAARAVADAIMALDNLHKGERQWKSAKSLMANHEGVMMQTLMGEPIVMPPSPSPRRGSVPLRNDATCSSETSETK